MSDNKETAIDPNQEIELEDLPVTESEQEQVKGGPKNALFMPSIG
jgi:hypothetical protein